MRRQLADEHGHHPARPPRLIPWRPVAAAPETRPPTWRACGARREARYPCGDADVPEPRGKVPPSEDRVASG